MRRIECVHQISNSNAEVFITTATKNRKLRLKKAYNKLISQKGNINWHWVIVDNGSTDGSLQEIIKWNDSRISICKYIEMTGCAYPVRNFAFDLLQLGLKNNFYKKKSWILNIDSDDELYDEYSLVQIMKLAKKSIYTKGGVSMAHGYAVWETYDENFRPIRSSCPAYVDSKFPEVKKMADIYERGLIFLAAIIPSSTMQWLRYPSEFSFEDDALNQKLMLTAMKKNQPWIYTDYPIILKGYSGDTMINRNNQLGDPKLEAVIGIGHKVTGIRAVIVNHLRTLRDYYVINDL